MLTVAIAAGVLGAMGATAFSKEEDTSFSSDTVISKDEATSSDFQEKEEGEWSAEDEDLFWAVEAEASVCWIYILDRVYVHDVGALIFTWILIMLLSTAELVAGFVGCFRLLSPSEGIPLQSFNAWQEPLLWLNTLRFVVGLSACTLGLSVLQKHHRSTARLKRRTFATLFNVPLVLHACSVLLSLLSIAKLFVLAWKGDSRRNLKASSPSQGPVSVSLSKEKRPLLEGTFLSLGRGDSSMRGSRPSPAVHDFDLRKKEAMMGYSLGASDGPVSPLSFSVLRAEDASESALYRPLLLSCLGMDGPVFVLHVVAFWLTWRIARKVGSLFGLRMPKLPF